MLQLFVCGRGKKSKWTRNGDSDVLVRSGRAGASSCDCGRCVALSGALSRIRRETTACDAKPYNHGRCCSVAPHDFLSQHFAVNITTCSLSLHPSTTNISIHDIHLHRIHQLQALHFLTKTKPIQPTPSK